MECVVSGRDSVVVLPTGGGKSLCFQAPALAMPGMALVISPLISLMKDQVDALTEWGVPAARLDSSLTSSERGAVFARIRQSKLRLLYISPERVVSDGFIASLGKIKISFIAIDEAHCVSMWGHDFRPEYRELGFLKETFPGVAMHGYTATATEHVRGDIVQQLRLRDPQVLVGSFDRPNLVYKVERRGNKMKQIRDVLDRHRSESGIVYCIRRVDVDEFCVELTDAGYRVLPYHAGMAEDARKRNQDAFIREEVDTIVATIAFGMGIDKSNVRYVIHTGMPKSLEHYQQESGRSGRDGLEAECCLFFSSSDYATWRSILRNSETQASEIAVGKLNDMNNYCTGVTCRHRALVTYFGQDLEEENCGACDVCLGDLDSMEDAQVIAQKILSCVIRLGEKFGADYTSGVLIGSRDQRIIENRHDTLSTYGLLSDHTKRIVRDWIEQLVAQECMRKTGEYNVLKVTSKSWRVLKGEETPRLLKPAEKRPKVRKVAAIARDSWEGVDRGLFEKLRALRWQIANERGIPAYIVFDDAALRDMARRQPRTEEEFLQVKGVGAKKSEQYSKVFTEAIIGFHQTKVVQD